MPGKPTSALLASLAKTLNKLSGQGLTGSLPASVSSSKQLSGLPESENDLHRMVEALERIATALEKLTTDAPSAEPEPEDYWIPLPSVLLPQETISINSQPPKSTVLLNYLKRHNVTLQEPKKLTAEQQNYEIKLEEIALTLGRNFAVCRELYNLLKKNLTIPRKTFTYSLVGATLEQNQIIRQFCQLLKDAQLLETFSYQGKPNFTIELKATGKEQKYLTGAWLEKYVKQEIERITQIYLTQPSMVYEALLNSEIVFSDATKVELDLFFALGKRVFCIEAKTHPTQKNLTDYIAKIKPLNLSAKQILIVVADKTEEACKQLTDELGTAVIGINNFEQDAKAWIEAALK